MVENKLTNLPNPETLNLLSTRVKPHKLPLKFNICLCPFRLSASLTVVSPSQWSVLAHANTLECCSDSEVLALGRVLFGGVHGLPFRFAVLIGLGCLTSCSSS
jgi:hypothetical protein